MTKKKDPFAYPDCDWCGGPNGCWCHVFNASVCTDCQIQYQKDNPPVEYTGPHPLRGANPYRSSMHNTPYGG